MPEPIRIDVWSDIACPWCYIGKRRLEAALRRFESDPDHPPVEVRFRSFELAPETPADFPGTETDFLVRHKGLDTEQVRAMLVRVTAIARGDGLDLRFESVRHTNTSAAHQLLHHALERGLQRAMKERLQAAYFVEGKHLGRQEVLADLAVDVGLDRDEALRALQAGEHLAAVKADQREATVRGIRGVPFFLFDGRYAVSGAQEPEVFEGVLAQVLADRAATTG